MSAKSPEGSVVCVENLIRVDAATKTAKLAK
jgi:hypothetical protein